MDTEDWFPEERRGYEEQRNAAYRAKQVCWSCPVLTECLRHALEMHDIFGVFGGTTGMERRAVMHLPRELAMDTLLIEVGVQQLWGERKVGVA